MNKQNKKTTDLGQLLNQEVNVGVRLREIRKKKKYSLRSLAEKSNLNLNTLSMIENSKTSPSVSTLQRISNALEIPISYFFDVAPQKSKVVFTPKDRRIHASAEHIRLQLLGTNLASDKLHQFVVQLAPGDCSGDSETVHTGLEFVYCLTGNTEYVVDGQIFLLEPGDSLVFEAYLPHIWCNKSDSFAEILLIFFTSDELENPAARHFSEFIS